MNTASHAQHRITNTLWATIPLYILMMTLFTIGLFDYEGINFIITAIATTCLCLLFGLTLDSFFTSFRLYAQSIELMMDALGESAPQAAKNTYLQLCKQNKVSRHSGTISNAPLLQSCIIYWQMNQYTFEIESQYMKEITFKRHRRHHNRLYDGI